MIYVLNSSTDRGSTMGCKNRSTQSPNSKHFHFEPSFYKLAACHVKTVNLRRPVGCEPCLFVSHFLLFVNYSTPRLLNGPFYSAFLKVSNNIYCLAGIFVHFADCYFLLSKLIFGICCHTLHFEMIFVKHRRYNPSPHFESFLNHTILKRLFKSKRKIPSCLY